MRITGNRLIDQSAASTAASQAKVADASAEMSSGLRVARPSDDPTAWAAAQRAALRRTLAGGESVALQAGRDRLDETDVALSGVGDAIDQIRSLAVQGASASYSASDRAGIAIQVRSLFASALASANTRSADGEYVLAGTVSTTAPFSAAGAYSGDAVERQLHASGTLATSMVAGSSLTAAGGVDVLPLMERVAAALAANDQTLVQGLLGDLDVAVKQVSLARSHVGNQMNVLDATLVAHAGLADHLTTEISRHVESDSVASASALAKASQALEFSRAVSSHVIGLLDPSR